MAFSNKKYVKIYRNSLIDSSKTFVQIIIPILSLLIAFVAITIKFDNLNKSNEGEQNELEKRIDALENLQPLSFEKDAQVKDTLSTK